MDASSRMGVARTLDPSEGDRRTHTLASVEPPSFDQVREPSQLRIVSILWILTHPSQTDCTRRRYLHAWYQRPTRVPRIQVCRPTDVRDILTARQHNTTRAGLDSVGDRAWDYDLQVNPCGNFSGTSSLKFRGTKGSIGHTFMVCIHTENQNQGDFYPFILLEISVLNESPLGHLRYLLTDVPPQPNSPPDNVIGPDRTAKVLNSRKRAFTPSPASPNK